MDHIEITSSFTNETWAGDIELAGQTDAEKLESAFYFFNRHDEDDALSLAKIGFAQPSMSAGDRVVLNGTAYQCDPVGFSPDERDPHQPLNPWPLGGTDG